MILGDYPTSGEARIYIGDKWVDDAFRIEMDEMNQKVPLMGYHQDMMADVANGKQLVTGSLMIHFRFPGYLSFAIQEVLRANEKSALEDSAIASGSAAPTANGTSVLPGTSVKVPTIMRFRDVKDTINVVRQLSVPNRVKLLQDSFANGSFEQHSAILETMFDVTRIAASRQDLLESPVTMDPDKFIGGRKGFDMSVYYGYVERPGSNGVYVAEVLEGVHMTGRRKVINASTYGGDLSTSGMSLMEVYSFFARRVRPVVSDNPLSFTQI